jgi:hypothetical protein
MATQLRRNRLPGCCWLYIPPLGIVCAGTVAHSTSTAPAAGTGAGQPLDGTGANFWETATAVITLMISGTFSRAVRFAWPPVNPRISAHTVDFSHPS